MGGGAVQDVDVEEGEQGEDELGGVRRHAPIVGLKNLLNWVKSDDSLEEVKHGVSLRGMGEVGERSAPSVRC